MAQIIYNVLKVAVGEGFDWATADVKILLLDAAGGYAPNPDHTFVADLVPGATELDTTNYVRKAVTGRGVNRNDTLNRAEWVADPIVFADLGPTVAGETIQAGVLFVEETNDADSWLIAYLDDITGTVNGLDATIAFDPTGIIRPT